MRLKHLVLSLLVIILVTLNVCLVRGVLNKQVANITVAFDFAIFIILFMLGILFLIDKTNWNKKIF